MQISQYGVELIRLVEDKIELLRSWRNFPEINSQMEYQDYITPEMQSAWFKKIDTLNNFYFLIKQNKNWLGLIHLSNIDYTKQSADAGLFISNPNFINSTYPIYASLSILNFAFNKLKLAKIRAKVKEDNETAIYYNIQLGFKSQNNNSSGEFYYLYIDPSSYANASKKWIEHAEKKYGKKMSISFNDAIPIDKKIQSLSNNIFS